jgi:hypothetical protein
MDKAYFFGINNEKVGPLDDASIQQRIREGAITADTLAWRSGMDNWQPVGNIAELKKEFNALLSKQTVPPPLPAGSHASGQAAPPPFPQKPSQASYVQSERAPDGLSPFEAQCFRFAMTCYRPMGKWEPPLRKMVIQDPKKAVPVALGTGIAMVFLVSFAVASFSQGNKQTGAPGSGGVQQVQQPDGSWRAQYNAIRDAQQFSSDVSNDVYKYRRDSQDRMDESYRRANYDWYKSDDK